MFRIIVESDYALFTRPEMKVERVTYSVPTPSALEGMLKSVYWKPAIRYVIDRIIVFNPILYTSICRNEVTEKVSESKIKKQMRGGEEDPVICTKNCINKRSALLLKNVKYGIEFHFELTGIQSEREENGNAKHADILRRRLEKGQYFRPPCMGCREFAVKRITIVDSFDLSEVDESLRNEQDLGNMLYCLKFRDDVKSKFEWETKFFSDYADAIFYHPFMLNGIIDVKKYREIANI